MKLAALAKEALALLIRKGWGEPVGIGMLSPFHFIKLEIYSVSIQRFF